jgi:hypothetical protein
MTTNPKKWGGVAGDASELCTVIKLSIAQRFIFLGFGPQVPATLQFAPPNAT